MNEFPDYAGSDYSFDYSKSNEPKKFSVHRVLRKYIQYFDKTGKPKPAFIKEILDDEAKLSATIQDAYDLKVLFNYKSLCLLEDGIFESILKNFELLDPSKSKSITHDFERLFDNLKADLEDGLKEQLLIKLKDKDNSKISHTRILQLYDLYKFMTSRENNYLQILNKDDFKPSHGYRPTSNSNMKSMHNMINFLWVKIGTKSDVIII